ncbi:pilus assembly protein PilP [Massilia horti]|uniref:Pilus assembly protein PilP n=2 Tax=Massilia horti TaxID=2562153 RepID=A0A4Y9T1F0_9BURK|nr:pilus assembly protein PilP [Massilia horti]
MARTTILALAALLLAGCGDSDVKEVRDWMAQVRKETKPGVKPLPEPKEFIPYAYKLRDAVDPFSPNKLQVELANGAEASENPLKPDSRRPRELLEQYPLDTMHLVGTLHKAGVGYGLVQIDKNVYKVKAGQRIGENYGLVTRVTENAIDIKETVQDAAGEWVERKTRLELQVSKESGK